MAYLALSLVCGQAFPGDGDLGALGDILAKDLAYA